MADKGLDDWVENDKQKLKNASGGVSSPNPAKAIEMTLWAIAILGIVFMATSLPFVGPDAYLSGIQWLAISLSVIVLFGSAATIVRLALP